MKYTKIALIIYGLLLFHFIFANFAIAIPTNIILNDPQPPCFESDRSQRCAASCPLVCGELGMSSTFMCTSNDNVHRQHPKGFPFANTCDNSGRFFSKDYDTRLASLYNLLYILGVSLALIVVLYLTRSKEKTKAKTKP